MIDLKPLKVGWFLGYRQVKRSSLWTTLLIIVIMTLTFMNLVVVSGLLVGLIEGAVRANKELYTGDVVISKLTENNNILNSRNIISTIENTPGIDVFSARYLTSGSVEANYKERTDFDEVPEKVGTIIAGIDPEKENDVTGIASKVIEGEFLEKGDYDEVVIGYLMLDRYLDIDSPGFLVLEDVYVGDKIRIQVGDNVREVTVKGITKGKVDELDRRIFINDYQLRTMLGTTDLNVNEISMKILPQYSPERIRDILIDNDFDRFAKIQTFEEAQPSFLVDIKNTFSLLGTIISSIGLVVAAITVFIVIFINAITRRKYIGIMKGIGMSGKSIEIAYIFQSLFYAMVGSAIGLVLVYFVFIPYFDANPINFPFSDGILVAPFGTTMIRILILVLVTAAAGYIPSRSVVKDNTLDSILGRR
jgi:ABC-type lipoprotein release transport system permease subunit